MNERSMKRKSALSIYLSCVLAVVVAGCATPGAILDIVDDGPSGAPTRYRQVFEDAFFDFDANRTVNIVLQSRSTDIRDPDSTIKQTVHIRSVWESTPGDTIAEKTQINATVLYVLQSGGLVACYEGGGALIFEVNKKGDEIKGTLELARLRPTQDGVAGETLFRRPVVDGKFRAVRNRRRVARVVNETNRLHRAATNLARTTVGTQ